MASFTLPNTPFPEGTSVSAYSAKGYASFPAGGPPGNPLATATVTKGSLTFSGLENHQTYFAAAQVSGAWRSWQFAVGENGPPPSIKDIDYSNVAPGYALVPNEDESGFEFFNIGMSKVELTPAEDEDKDTERLQEALGNESPNEVLLGGVSRFLVKETVIVESLKKMSGSGRGVTLLSAVAGLNDDVLRSASYEENGVIDVSIRDMTIDGNSTNNTEGHCLATHGQRVYVDEVTVLDAPEDGHHSAALGTKSESDKDGGGLDSRDYKVTADNCGRYGIFRDDHDFSLLDCSAIQCATAGIYTDANGLLVNCHTWSYAGGSSGADTGIRLAGDTRVVNCTAEGSEKRQILLSGPNISLVGCDIFAGTNFPDCAGVEFGEGATSVLIDGCYIHEFGTGGGLLFTASGQNSHISAHLFDAGNHEAGQGEPHKSIFWDITLGGSTARGTIPAFTGRQRYTLIPLGSGSNIPGNTFYVDEADSNKLKFKDTSGTIRRVPNGSRGALSTSILNETIDTTYGEQEKKTIENLRTVVGELKTKLEEAAILVS